MSYLALARKWRPLSFADVLGQPHVVKALSHALAQDKLHPAILLTGTRGVGKTTLARIVAKGLNCEKGVRSEGCGECSACAEVDQGRFVDLMEIDAASNTGVDNVRELIDNAQYSPVRGRYKVYLIDEVHMLSKSAFNALLKTLEEPPPHVKFILATTDPQKLPVTVLSRCLQFNLKRLPISLIRDRLAQVLEAEGHSAEVPALAEIARGADGSMRDGLSLLDQALAYSGGEPLKREAMEEMLGTIGRRSLLELLAAVAADDRDRVFELLQKLETQAPDYAALLNALAAYLQQLALLQMFKREDEDQEPELKPLADQLAAEDIQLYYQISVNARRDLPWAPDPRAGFEMAVMRMLAFRLDEGGAATSGGGAPRARASRSAAGASGSAEAEATGPAPAPARPAAAEARSSGSGKTDANGSVESRNWPKLVRGLGLKGLSLQFAMHCAVEREQDGTLILGLDPQYQHLKQDARQAELVGALQAHGVAQQVVIKLDKVGTTPAELADQARRDRQARAEQSIENDPVVIALKREFDATVRPGSVRPLDS